MKRYCFALDLKDDPALIAAYDEHHSKVWPEIIASIKNFGITDMQIYRTGTRLFMMMDTRDDFDPQAKAAADAVNDRVQEWEQLMLNFQQPLPWAKEGQKWIQMDKIFQL